MNPAQFEQMPSFIKKEMDAISEKIRPIMKKVSTYYMFGFPLMIVGIINLISHYVSNDFNTGDLVGPVVYALIAALGIALFQESRLLRKQIHQVGKTYMEERIKKSDVMNEAEKNRYIATIRKMVKLDFQPFIRFLTEENQRSHDYFK
ncbi:hypothetical protein SAMN05421734_1022 [Pelagirhabdus alkalitolerans]|uniref:Uncharacterized protein n=1 Tax=Pelagirhabdus alkalitolerans TaxID=1612202 RepID=A0A1G6GX39_9BACI|nr:DUF5392 family protein [Pelagirhabdus alkalitolerans]SDB86620.1 hypothetical protein SAMN05421734_1022 [Pelagirhabdus alkalitolerans]